jgi:gamma-glutamyl-gamma-aminobutyrate hydrolase PuuD
MGLICSFLCAQSYYEKEAEANKEALDHDVLRVGLCPDWRVASDGRYWYFTNIILYYRKLLTSIGGRLIVLNYDDRPEAWAGKLHGLIISGGRDIDPAFYGQANTHSSFKPLDAAKRWHFSKAWLTTEVCKSMPIFGICYGMQVINCVLGGDLEQRIKSRFSHSGAHRTLQIRPDSFLAKALGKLTMKGKCYHKQGIQRIPDWLQPVAWDSEDDTVHALEYIGKDGRIIMAVLWHPEAIYESTAFEKHEADNLLLLRHFLGACGEYRKTLPTVKLTN